ncbi:MAG TPA: PilN domain-containing protein [Vicinamibacterales bacterium]|nr:PilN domain-containing protein [Vicinamibacterales bacterium]
MLRTNLATRPFYNERVIHFWLGVATLVILGLTAFNVARVLQYSRSDTRLQTQSARDEARADDLRKQAARLRGSVDPKKIEFKSAEARLANELIDRRTFSWTELLNRFETTLPDEVRIVAVRPKVDRNRGIQLQINVVARDIEDINTFLQNMEKTGAFARVISHEEHPNEQGQFDATLETTYVPSHAAAGGTTGQQ